MQHIIVPGWNGSGASHWQSVWESGWLPDAIRIEPASWDHPDRDDWTAAIERAVQKADDEVVLITHSLGCFAVAHWLTSTPYAEPGRAVRGSSWSRHPTSTPKPSPRTSSEPSSNRTRSRSASPQY